MAVKKEEPTETFDWGELKRQLDAVDQNGVNRTHRGPEAPMDKMKRKFGENPLIPIGSILTTAFLGLGLMSFLRKRSDLSQTMMRGRVFAQGFTVVALAGGVAYGFVKNN